MGDITQVTQNAIFDELTLSDYWWPGNLDEVAFLARLYPLDTMPSGDPRFDSAAGDIWQHRVNNAYDWSDDWVFSDSRFGLRSSDETLLTFLAETLHPVVRPKAEEAAELAAMYNRHLRADGYELHPTGQISGRPVYAARTIVQGAPALHQIRSPETVDLSYVSRQITRIESSIETDPELAIGTSKELVESVAKTILDQRGQPAGKKDDLGKVVRNAARALDLHRDSVPDAARAADTIQRVLSNLNQVVDGVAELRNAYGTGHGRPHGGGGLRPRHARLVAGAASTLALFMWETHIERPLAPVSATQEADGER